MGPRTEGEEDLPGLYRAMLEEIDTSDRDALSAVWGRLRILLEVHAKAEELLFYPRLVKLQRDLVEKESPQEETEDAIHDHNEIATRSRASTITKSARSAG